MLCALRCVVSCLALSIGLAACGGEERQPAAALLQQTFRDSRSAIDDGYLSLSVRTAPAGGGGAATFTLLGPFSAPRRTDELERFDLEFAATQPRRPPFVVRLRASAAAPAGRPRLPVTGFDPLRWIIGAERRRHERAVGVNTIRIGGTVNVERFLADVDALFALSSKRRRQIAAAADASSIDIWTGAADQVLRQISVRVRFAALRTLDAGTIDLHLRLDDVNQGGAAAASSAVPSIRRGGGGTGERRRALRACLTTANGGGSALVRCVAKLAPEHPETRPGR